MTTRKGGGYPQKVVLLVFLCNHKKGWVPAKRTRRTQRGFGGAQPCRPQWVFFVTLEDLGFGGGVGKSKTPCGTILSKRGAPAFFFMASLCWIPFGPLDGVEREPTDDLFVFWLSTRTRNRGLCNLSQRVVLKHHLWNCQLTVSFLFWGNDD